MVYIPQFSPHSPSCSKWEVMVEKEIPGVTSGCEVALIFQKPFTATNYGAVIG